MDNNRRLARARRLWRERKEGRLGQVCARLGRIQPDTERARRALEQCAARLAAAEQRLVRQRRSALAASMQTLQALDPGRVLARGYALVRNGEDRKSTRLNSSN